MPTVKTELNKDAIHMKRGQSGKFHNLRMEEEEENDLIPGISNDLAARCISVLPWPSMHIFRNVSKSWRRLIDSHQFPLLRKQVGAMEGWICIILENPDSGNFLLFNTHSNRWYPLQTIFGQFSMESWEGFSCVSIGHRLFIIGGVCRSTKMGFAAGPRSDVIVYNSFTNQWSKAANMNHARSWFAAGVHEHYIYVAGGHSKTCVLDCAEVYDFHNNVWRLLPPMNAVRSSCRSVVLNNQFWVVGGEYERHQYGVHPPKFSAEYFDLSSRKWTLIREMGYNTEKIPEPCISHKGKLLSIHQNNVLAYDVAENRWVQVSRVSRWSDYNSASQVSGFAFESFGDKVYIIGGMQMTWLSGRPLRRLMNSVLISNLECQDGNKNQRWLEGADMGPLYGTILASCTLTI